jgi:hypothetical protein
MSAYGFTILSCLFVNEIQIKFLPASMKSLTNCTITSSNPLQRASSSFLKAACVSKSNSVILLKIVTKVGYECHCTKEKIDQ